MRHIGDTVIISKEKGDTFSFNERNCQQIFLYPSLKAHRKMNISQRKRTFPFSSCKKRGSMTLEGCLLLPILLFFMMTVLMGLEVVRLQSNVRAGLCEMQQSCYEQQAALRLHYEAQEICPDPAQVIRYLDDCADSRLCLTDTPVLADTSDAAGNGRIEVSVTYRVKPFIYWLPLQGTAAAELKFEDRLVAHAFNGYRGPIEGDGTADDREYVYVTPEGTRYHQSRECVSLRIRIEAVSTDELYSRRNQSGGRYAPCERCHPSENGLFYITAEGDRYHARSDCASLKRTVRMVLLEEAVAEGRSACQKCGG